MLVFNMKPTNVSYYHHPGDGREMGGNNYINSPKKDLHNLHLLNKG